RERASELEAHVDRPLAALPRHGEVLEDIECLFEVGGSLPVGRAPDGFGAGLTEVADGVLPQFALDGVVREPLDVLGEVLRIERLDPLPEATGERWWAGGREVSVGPLVGEGVLEGVARVRD